MVKVFYKRPGGRYISKERSGKTVATRNPNTGRLTGRKKVKGEGDGTGVLRVKEDFVRVKRSKDRRGHVRVIRKNILDGQIAGRF